MTGKHSLSEQDIVNLLGRLKSIKSEYPADLQTRRRTLFLSSIAAGSLLGISKHINLAHGVEAPMSTAMKVAIGVLTTSAIAVTTSLGVLVYENRVMLVDRLFGKMPTAVYFSPIPASATLITPIGTLTLITPTETPTPTSELTPTVISMFTSGPEITPVPNTEIPVNVSTDDNPGKHLGQTPHPGGTPPGHTTP